MNTSKMTKRERQRAKAQIAALHAELLAEGKTTKPLTGRLLRKQLALELTRRKQTATSKPIAKKRIAVAFAGSVRQKLAFGKQRALAKSRRSVRFWMNSLGLSVAKAA